MLIRTLVLLAAAAMLGLQLYTTPVSAGQRVALVIGNASYAHAPSLANPLNDATDISAALDRLGFAVTRLDNAGRAELWDGLQKFSLAASASEMAVVFYAGHGIEVDKRNFLIPVDAQLLSDAVVEFETVPLDLLSRAVEPAKGLRLIILDACRNNPFAVKMQRTGATRSIGRGLARVEPSGETLVAYSAKEGTVAEDGDGRNSPYATALLAHLEKPGLEVGLMFRKVRDAVLASTGGRQEPFVYGSLSSEGAYLAAQPEPEPAPTVVKTDPRGDGPTQGELLFWESVKDSTHAADLEAYLKKFPSGIYEELARNRLKRLKGAKEKPDVRARVTPDEPRIEVKSEPPAPTPESIEAALGLDREERRLIQRGLASFGFDPGAADGLFGQRTRQALETWQFSQEMATTGYLDLEAAKVLLARGEEATRKWAAEEAARKKAAEEEARKRAAIRPGRVFRDCPECPEMVVVPSGSFLMGSPSREKGRDDDESPQHRVMIPVPIAVSKYEITTAEWRACVLTGVCTADFWNDVGPGQEPVSWVSWNDAKSYVAWLSLQTGERYRLLSEAEWEYAARAGTRTSRYWGDDVSEQCDHENGYDRTADAKLNYDRWIVAPCWDGSDSETRGGSYGANSFGLSDMLGNLREWVEDCWHESYAGAPTDGSAWVTGGKCDKRVIRGGSWSDFPRELRSAERSREDTDSRDNVNGLRVARTLAP